MTMKKLTLFLLALTCALAHAQNLSQPILQPHVNLFDGSGAACAGCSLYSYSAGTTTPKPTYTNSALGTQNTNPIVLDASGGAIIWTDLGGYKFILKDASGTTLWSVDNVVSVAGLGCLGANNITHGCTGATTAQGAATNIVDGNNIKPATVLNANVNGVYTITKYGAVGDCTPTGATAGCTDNTSAIQAAIDAAYITGGAVYLPTNPGAPGPTVYYAASTINPEGVSIYGPPGGGAAVWSGTWANVNVRGAPNKDVFAPGDRAAVGYVTPLQGFTIKDFGIIPDDSNDTSSSLGAHRKPGKTCSDVLATSSSAVITSATCEFMPGDVGQSISLTDGTHTLATTIASISSGSSATLSANWTNTTHANSVLYVAVMNMATSRTVGNCAFAYDDSSTTSYSPGINPATFQDLNIVPVSGSWKNNSCAFFFQGQAGQPYNTKFDHIFSRSVWGYVFALADNLGSGVTSNASLGDFVSFRSIVNQGTIPWVSYDGQYAIWDDFEFSTAQYGPQILAINESQEIAPTYWNVHGTEFEQITIATPGMGWRVEGIGHSITGATLAEATNGTPAYWSATNSQCINCSATATVNLGGSQNSLFFGPEADSVTVVDTGYRNQCALGKQDNPFNGAQPSLWASCNIVNSRQTHSFAHTADFVANGNELTPYNNQADLWLWPPDVQNYYGIAQPTIVADTASETGSHALIPQANGADFAYLNGKAFIVGQSGNVVPNLPATMVHVCAKWKADSGSGNATFDLGVPIGTPVGTITVSLTTAYATSCFDADLTALSGDTVEFAFSSSAVDMDVAWISVRPFNNSTVGFTSGSGATGYWVKDPTGTITEHGTISVTQTGATVATSTITFPLTFPTAVDSLVLTAGAAPAGGGTDALTFYYTGLGTSGAGVTLRCSVNIGGSGCSNIGTSMPISWIAIGH